ncbi:hypothetical protein BDV28DRAFT_140718 [Aspergillus coremiiformis]|uniref:Cyanovirin-N domain-containing protein n=1 Tax=Aspergillus coremiiformis TaxID=138285 RepID=A0A5N6YW61_9EURO|nr:hypothetical protein BDV28DRAFT_140718 [Aspergillus coremiiformis]
MLDHLFRADRRQAMYWTWFLIACYLTTALAEAPLPHQRVSFGGVRGPSQQTLNLHIHCRDIEIVNTPPSNPNAPPTSSVLRRPARRASIPLQPKPYITAICRAKDGKERRTTLALNYCLGWQQKQGGALIPQDTYVPASPVPRPHN